MRRWSGTQSPVRTGRWRAALLILPLLVTGVAVAGCSDAGSGSSAQAPAADGAARASDGAAPQAAEAGSDPAATAADPAVADRRRVSRGCVVVTVTDLGAAATKVRALAAGHGGYVAEESMGVSATAATDDYYGRYDTPDDVAFGSDAGGTVAAPGYAEGSTSATALTPDTQLIARPGEARIVLRVDPDQTAAVMDAIAAVGTEASRWRTDTDVEATLVDLQSRIETKTQSIATLRGFLAKTSKIEDIITLEQEISTRTADLESMKARQSALNDAVAYSTVTAVLRTPERSEQASENGFVVGLKSGWAALTGSLRVLLVLIGALLPFAAVALVLGLPARKLLAPRLAARRDRRRARRAAQSPWPGGAAPAAQVGQAHAVQAPAGQPPTGPAPAGQPPAAPDDPSRDR